MMQGWLKLVDEIQSDVRVVEQMTLIIDKSRLGRGVDYNGPQRGADDQKGINFRRNIKKYNQDIMQI